MSGTRLPPQPPVDIPDHLSHGTSYVHRHYRCRCEDCQSWRRGYDQARDAEKRHGRKEHRQRLQTGGWYVCRGSYGEPRGHHLYLGSSCVRCGADEATETYWEAKWKESES